LEVWLQLDKSLVASTDAVEGLKREGRKHGVFLRKVYGSEKGGLVVLGGMEGFSNGEKKVEPGSGNLGRQKGTRGGEGG